MKNQQTNNPFEQNTSLKKAPRTKLSTKQKTLLLVAVIVVIIVVPSAVYDYIHDATRIENNYDYATYFAANDYPDGTISLNQVDGKTSSGGSYGLESGMYTVGEQVDPGLYQIEMIPLDNQDFYAELTIEKSDDSEPFVIYLEQGSPKPIYNNINLEAGDVLSVTGNSSIAYSINLIPQSAPINYDPSVEAGGIYHAPDQIEAGSYKMGNFVGYICDDGYTDQDDTETCDSIYNTDERFVIADNQNLYVSRYYSDDYL